MTEPELLIPLELDEFKYAFHDAPRAVRAIILHTLKLADPSNSGSVLSAKIAFGLDETAPKTGQTGLTKTESSDTMEL